MVRGDARPSSRREWLALVRRLRANAYDLAVETRGNSASRVLAYSARARLRIGPEHSYYEHFEPPEHDTYAWLMTHTVPMTDAAGAIDLQGHAVDNGIRVLADLGMRIPEPHYRFDLVPGDRTKVAATLESLGVRGGYAAIHGSSTDEMRQWQPARFAAVADHLAKAYDLDVILTGAPGDRKPNERIKSQCVQQDRVHNAAGLIALKDLPALFERAKIVVTIDTGPMHIAAAVGAPIVALFLPWLVAPHHPFGQRDGVLLPFTGTLEEAVASGAYEVWSGDLLDGISVEDVLQAVDRKMMKE
jgi:ADP-heptose:LPS heptosyltransferase